MSRRRWNILDTLQGKLVAASALLVVGALVLSSGVFVFLTHGKENQHALDHTIATAPSIHSGFLQDLLAGGSVAQLTSYVEDAAKRYDVRILMFDYSGLVVDDTGGKLAGTQLAFPQDSSAPGDQASTSGRRETWRVDYGSGHSLTLAALSPTLVVGGRRISISAGEDESPSRGPSRRVKRSSCLTRWRSCSLRTRSRGHGWTCSPGWRWRPASPYPSQPDSPSSSRVGSPVR